MLAPVLSRLAAAGRPDPKYAVNLTLYHINPLRYGTKPVNMDTGDLHGDMTFDVASKIRPLACGKPCSATEPPLCNPWCSDEELGDDTDITSKMVVEVDARYGEYGQCNICNKSGIDPYNHARSCQPGEYVCDCGGQPPWGHPSPCNASVGQLDVTNVLGPQAHSCDPTVQADGTCWFGNTFKKIKGFWYSTTAEGRCDDSATSPCTWRVVQVVKKIMHDCHMDRFLTFVEGRDSEGCFAACGEARNTTSPCWASCFFDTVLGPGAKNTTNITGIPLAELSAAWDAPFHTEDPSKGGCPAVP